MKKLFRHAAAATVLLVPAFYPAHADDTRIPVCAGVEAVERNPGDYTVYARGGRFFRNSTTLQAIEQEFCQPT